VRAEASESTTTTTAGDPASLSWGDCDEDMAAAAGLECASLQVPLDPADPSGETIEIALARPPSTGSADDRIGSLVINPGGPGGSGIDFLAGSAAAFPKSLTRHFELVAFDPRGVGASTPVRCVDDATKDAQLEGDLSPDTPQELDRAVADQAEFLAGWQRHASKLLAHMCTGDVAADLDRIRIAVGDEQLTYLGYSYGTEIGAVYATLYPSNSRALVLDGSVSPSATSEEQTLAQAQGFEHTLANFVTACNADASCALGPDAASAIASTRASLEADPVQVSTDTGTRTLGIDQFDIGLASALYDTTLWGTAAQAIKDVRTSGVAVILSLVDQQVGRQPDGTYDNSSDVQTMVNCSDTTERPTVAQAQEAAARIIAAVPTFGPALGWSELGCIGWPQAANPVPPLTGAGAPTVLVVGTLGDPATPYQWAQQMATTLEDAVLLTYEGDGHTAFLHGGPCIDDAEVDYLVDLEVPAEGTSCPAQSSASGFGGLRDEVVDELVRGGLPKALAECVIDGVIDAVGSSEFDRMVLEQDTASLQRLVQAQTLGCASAGG
jgi:pimeloyl-ACP methyl ester carboxylesterase